MKTIRPNEIVTDVTYDALDHITKLVTSCAGCEEVLSTYEYTYNDQGYITSEKATESLAGYVYDDKHDGKHEDGKHDSEYPHGNKHDGKHDKDGTNAIRVVTTERTYEYDENWQLTKCTEEEENEGTTTYSYKYDSAGNRTAYEKVSKGETVEKYSYKYNDSNQLISKTEKTDWRFWKHVTTDYEYDEDGNLISESSDEKDTTTYEYTVENHLKAVTTSNEVLMAALYDGDGNRLFTLDYVEDGNKSQKGQVLIPEGAKTDDGDSPAEQLASLVPKKNQEEYYSITQYVNDINRENTETLMELKTDGTANAAYTYGYNRNSRDTADGASYYLYDGRGSVSGLASAAGVTTDSYQYDPYGNTIFGTPVSINYYGYNAESTNTNTGYQYLRARYYNPANGNFTTEDTNTGTTENPLTRNRYGYVNNNPLNYIDPTGHSLWSRIKKGASNLWNSAKKAVNNFGKSVSNLFNKAVTTVGNIAKSIGNGLSTARKPGKVSMSQGKVNWNQANIKSIAGNTGIVMPTTASRVTTVADAGALVDTLASGWDDLIELLRTIGPSALGALSLPSVPMVVGGAALVFIISLAWPPIEAGESDEDIAEWKKQQEEKKKNQKPATTDDDKNNDSSDEERETVTNN